MYKSLFLTILLSLPLYVQSQHVLLLSHVKKDKQVAFFIGDHIRLQLISDKSNRGGYIEAVTDSFIVLQKTISFQVNGNTFQNQFRENIPLCNIRRVYKLRSDAWAVCRRVYYAGSVIVGSTLIGITILNTFIHFIPPPFGAFVFITGVLVSGLLIKYAGLDHYRIGKRWVVEAVPSSPPFETHR